MTEQPPPPPPGGYGQQPPGGGYGQQPPPPPPGGGYGQQPYGAPAPGGNNKKATWALVTGIVGLLCCGPLGIVAIILGRGAEQEIRVTGEGGAGMAKAGLILGIVALAFLVLQIILVAGGVVTLPGSTDTTP
jgi:hypothetical protein